MHYIKCHVHAFCVLTKDTSIYLIVQMRRPVTPSGAYGYHLVKCRIAEKIVWKRWHLKVCGMSHKWNTAPSPHDVNTHGEQILNQINRRSNEEKNSLSLQLLQSFQMSHTCTTFPKPRCILRKSLMLMRNLCEQIRVWEPFQFLTNSLGALVAGGSNDVQSWSFHPCAFYSMELMHLSRAVIFSHPLIWREVCWWEFLL